MVELLVMRHAKSAWDTGAADFDRPLNDRGVRSAATMAEWLCEQALCPNQVLASSARRAVATIEPVVEACGVAASAVVLRRSLYLAHLDDWLSELAYQSADRILVCGHNPGLDDLVVELVGRTPRLTRKGKLMTTAAIAHLRIDGGFSGLAAGCADLVGLQRP